MHERKFVLQPYADAVHRQQVIALWKATLGYDAPHNRPEVSIDRKLAVDDGLFFVALDGDTVTGTIMAGYDGHRGWIYSVAVLPNHRRQGLGSKLLAHAEAVLTGLGCVKINLQIAEGNESVAAFYAAAGFAVEKRISMGKRILLCLLLLLCLSASAQDVYHLRRLTEPEILSTYSKVLREACHYSDRFWTNSSFDPVAGYWGDGVNDGNQGIRAIGGMILTSATLLKYCPDLTAAERRDWKTKAQAAIRYATATHVTGKQKCVNGRQWGGTWQSAMWTATIDFGGWLMHADLDAPLRADLERVIAFESDRFLANRPPGGRFLDTKAEENGWNLICMAVALNQYPRHPHAADWELRATDFALNTLSVPQDFHDETIIAGLPVREWITTENLHPDFTLENHGFFHPAYVGCSSYFLTQTAMYFTYAGKPVPAWASHHLLDTWHMLRTIIIPGAEAAFPQNMDWEVHGLNFINLFASLATWQRDPLAARIEQNCLQYVRAWQQMAGGSLAVPGSSLGFTRHAICCEQTSHGFLAHKIFGPAAPELFATAAAARVAGVYDHPYADFIFQRTTDKLVSFSWKNRLMGMVMPISPAHEDNPFFTVPLIGGLLGSFELAPANAGPTKIEEHSREILPTGFKTKGTLLLNGGKLQQTLELTSLGKQTAVFQDHVTALADLSLTRELGVPLGIENDEVSGRRRVVRFAGGETTFEWGKPRQQADIPGTWANVDGRLGLIVVQGSGLSYRQAKGYDPHQGVCTDILYGSYSSNPARFQTGETVAHRIIILLTEISPEQTATIARSAKIGDTLKGRELRFPLPEGGEARIPLF